MARFLLERALMPLAPGWALRRIGAHVQAEAFLRAYDAAKPSRATKSWRAPSTSARTEDAPALRTLRDRSRDLGRNNPWAKTALLKLPAHIVGTGVVPRTVDGAERTRNRALSAWRGFAEECDAESDLGHEAQQALAIRTVVESGEALVLWDVDRRRAGGWATRVLEPDYLDERFNEVSRNGSGRIIGGIELSARGERVAYHLFREHPGDMYPMLNRLSERVRVPAEFVDHIFHKVRPGQLRGIPWMAASMLGLRDMSDYIEAERWRKKITAALAAFVTTQGTPATSGLGAVRTETSATGEQRGIEKIAPGTIKRLLPGESVTFSSPPADQGLDAYLRWELYAICAGLGLPYAELTGDLSNANYSSMRAGKLEFWNLLDAWQWLMVEPMLLKRAWRRVQATSGVPGMACEWGFPKRHWVDPVKDVTAEIRAIRAGLTSSPEAIGSRGYDWRRTLAEQAEYKAAADAAGLVLDTDPARTALSGAANAEPTPGN
ncbi:phage portal protein [Roseococcus sp. SDR]|uniref:phage portal protein n=1 Tax=Roseococcus sp. SDR TaxID=2835532 RepID=UPI001BCB3370|nr:phage portal protein [Roseococcus sp. SDR]MBS7789267.1 phage portal protein [Roseococcus sp. SDR]MBV1844581.1 phage portal protein [Roseococcus sp. SDR]